MGTEPIKTFKHKGLTIDIFQDLDSESPDVWKNEDVFLVHYHRDFEVRRDDLIAQEELERFYSGEKIEKQKDYHIFLVKAYIHSGVVLALAESGRIFPDERWDVSKIGSVLVSKKEARTKKKALELAGGLIETWNDYLSGNVYGYTIENEGGCWGVYGDFETSGIIEEAKAEAEGLSERKTAKHIKGLKAQIKNGVALEKRQAFSFC